MPTDIFLRQRRAPARPGVQLGFLLFGLVCLGGCKTAPGGADGKTVISYGVRAAIGNLDPVQASSQYRSLACGALYDTLIEFRYTHRPFELRPSLLTKMPEVSADGRTYSFELRKGIYFQDNEAFPGGKGRELVASDVLYSLRRSCDAHWKPTGYWLLSGRVVGLDEYKQSEADRKSAMSADGNWDQFVFDYEKPIEGFRILDDHHFEIELVEPFPQFLYILTMAYTAVVPREAVEFYDLEFGQNPVGSGPFRLKKFWRGSYLHLERNPTYREERVPAELSPSELAVGLGDYIGRKLPIADEVHLEIYQQDQPMWLKFRAGDLSIAQAPAEYWPTVFYKDGTLKPEAVEADLQNYNLALLDLIYWGFNMDDPFWGQSGTPEQAARARKLRQAVSYAVDLESRNNAFYNGKNTLYIGPIPPGLDGYVEGWRPQDLDKARALLAEAGFPNGEGLPPLKYETSNSSNNIEQAEMFSRQLAQVGMKVEANFNSFPELSDKLRNKKAPFFGLAWGADYPDSENFLQLFYGPNESPGSNNFNYKNPVYDALFAKAKVMPPSPERREIYSQLREILIEDQPMIGSMARTRFYLWHGGVKNFKPEEVYSSWWKYLDSVPSETR